MTTPQDEPMKYPFEDDHRLTIPAEFAELRAKCPVQRITLPYGGDGWLMTKHADVKIVLGDPRFSRAATVDADIPRTTPWKTEGGGDLLAMDPPEHARLRRLVAAAFSRKNVERWRPRTEQIVDGLIDDVRSAGAPADLVELFSMPLPITVICELLGVPVADRHFFQRFSELVFGGAGVSAEDVENASTSLATYLAEHVARHRAEPQDDLLSQLIAARDEDEDRLTEEELVTLGVTILVAGHETTANEIANIVHTLLVNDLWAGLVAHPERIDTALDELLRCVPLGGSEAMPRVATEDIEVGGTLIRKGDTCFPAMISANFDEDVFSFPDVLDLDRPHNPHLAFGFGPHYCLGAQLARMELRVALTALLRAFPGLRLALPESEIPWRGKDTLIRGPRELLVSW
ncbi:cytochrome P450 [Saccharopolyspora shandongensis]|uniref:cytochrome P450 n=1 Tax=Saccharopolyspora shandongensis TaxID=418495 RepID=UPI0033E43115